ncbi:MAG: SCO family protein [Rhodothermia bacterium]|nr:SCO family protein [Rhodothermia bacterium]
MKHLFVCCFVVIGGLQGVWAQMLNSERTFGDKIQNTAPEIQQATGIDEHLGAFIPLDATFRDEEGKTVKLSSYFKGEKPVLLNFAYHTCPLLCHYVLDGIVAGAKSMPWVPGKEYEIISISIQPTETPELAKRQKKNYLAKLNKIGAEKGWHFLTGDEAEIRKVANTVGFRYKWDEKSKQFSHSAAIMLLSGEGKISRYLYGIRYSSKDLRNGLLEAAEGKVGTTIDKVFLWCYHYDPTEKSYVLNAYRLMQIGMGIVLTLVAVGLVWYWKTESKTKSLNPEDFV